MYYKKGTLGAIIIILICNFVIFFYLKELGFDKKDFLTMSTLSLLAITALIAFYQLKANHEWSRRKQSLVQLIDGRPSMTESIRYLNANINYREKKDAMSLAEIHKFICGEEDHNKNPEITKDGKEIKHHIFNILNYYEFLAIGIKQRICDEEVIKNSARGSLLKAQKVFGEYIAHLRTEKHTNNPNLFIEIQYLASKWKSEEDGSANQVTRSRPD